MCQVFYYKMRQFYYEMRQLLQIATVQCRSMLIEKSQRGSGEKKAILENNLWPHL